MFSSFFKNLDIFGEPVPSFKISGRGTVKTYAGAIVSITIILLTLMFGLMKFQGMIIHKNPNIVSNEIQLEAGKIYATAQDEFMMAFAAESYSNGNGISDPRYVRWITGYKIRIGTEWSVKYYPMYQCRDEDFTRFFTPDTKKTEIKVQRLREGGHFYCLDWKALGFDLYGKEVSAVDVAALDPMLIPCASRVTLFDDSIIGGDDECVWDQSKTDEIMDGAYNFITYHN